MSSKHASTDFSIALAREGDRIEQRLVELTSQIPDDPAVIKGAVCYSLLEGGKRLRPVLCLWTHDLLGGSKREACLDVACAIETLHTYSLIHDDLPCMDDDDLRRGKPSSHKQYGEAIAVLTGDALLTMCFEIISSIGDRWSVPPEQVVTIVRLIAKTGGPRGLIRGQALDLLWENKTGNEQLVQEIHTNKTAILIAASMEAGSILAGANAADRTTVRNAGLCAGRAFQIMDDVLDIETENSTLGKTAGKDAKQGKLTYPAAVGLEESKSRAALLVAEAKANLRKLGDAPLLEGLFEYFVRRNH
jgi:geranylgeranyl diphosphate synthase type II